MSHTGNPFPDHGVNHQALLSFSQGDSKAFFSSEIVNNDDIKKVAEQLHGIQAMSEGIDPKVCAQLLAKLKERPVRFDDDSTANKVAAKLSYTGAALQATDVMALVHAMMKLLVRTVKVAKRKHRLFATDNSSMGAFNACIAFMTNLPDQIGNARVPCRISDIDMFDTAKDHLSWWDRLLNGFRRLFRRPLVQSKMQVYDEAGEALKVTLSEDIPSSAVPTVVGERETTSQRTGPALVLSKCPGRSPERHANKIGGYKI